jgi:YVTN family beta-propeller protein
VLELPGGRLVSRATTEESFYGIAFTKDGSKLFCSGAGQELVHEFAFKDGYLSAHDEIRLRDVKERGIPAGLACTADGRTLYVANVWSHSISVVDLAKRTVAELHLGTNAVSAPRDLPPPTSDDEASITKRAEALLDQTKPEDPFPYACALDEKGGRLYVSLWAQSSVAVIDTGTLQVLHLWRVEEHPNEMLLSKNGKYLFVANANRNSVSVIDTGTGQPVETLIAELKPNSPPGSTPNSLALSPDEKTLFVHSRQEPLDGLHTGRLVSDLGACHSRRQAARRVQWQGFDFEIQSERAAARRWRTGNRPRIHRELDGRHRQHHRLAVRREIHGANAPAHSPDLSLPADAGSRSHRQAREQFHSVRHRRPDAYQVLPLHHQGKPHL